MHRSGNRSATWSVQLNHTAEARDAYATALKLETENAGRKRLRTKMAF